MRVWDVPPSELCSRHLVAEHSEIHAIWSVITGQKRGFANHPEVMRWRDHLPALARRHDQTAAEMRARGFRHASLLPVPPGTPEGGVVPTLATPEEQRAILAARRCGCYEKGLPSEG